MVGSAVADYPARYCLRLPLPSFTPADYTHTHGLYLYPAARGCCHAVSLRSAHFCPVGYHRVLPAVTFYTFYLRSQFRTHAFVWRFGYRHHTPVTHTAFTFTFAGCTVWDRFWLVYARHTHWLPRIPIYVTRSLHLGRYTRIWFCLWTLLRLHVWFTVGYTFTLVALDSLTFLTFYTVGFAAPDTPLGFTLYLAGLRLRTVAFTQLDTTRYYARWITLGYVRLRLGFTHGYVARPARLRLPARLHLHIRWF